MNGSGGRLRGGGERNSYEWDWGGVEGWGREE